MRQYFQNRKCITCLFKMIDAKPLFLGESELKQTSQMYHLLAGNIAFLIQTPLRYMSKRTPTTRQKLGICFHEKFFSYLLRSCSANAQRYTRNTAMV